MIPCGYVHEACRAIRYFYLETAKISIIYLLWIKFITHILLYANLLAREKVIETL